jgi:hypothetical protein
MKLTKSQLKEMIKEELKLTEAKKPAQLIKSKGSGRFSGNYVFVKNTDVGYMYQQAGRSGKPLKSGNTQYFTFKHYKDEVEKGKNYDIVREELKLTEDYKNSKWEVYVGDDAYGKNRKVVKVAKSKRAATILYNKLIKTDKYFEVGMRAVTEGKLNENYNKVWNNWVSALDNFEKATVNLAKYNSKVTADKVDERIILQNFKKYINPFYNLMKSWKKGKN